MEGIWKIARIYAIVMLTAILIIIPVFAALGTTESSIVENVTSGERFVKNITVYNNYENQTMDIEAEVYGMIQLPDGTTNAVTAEKDTYEYSARPFFNIIPSSIHLAPGTREQIAFEGTIPKDAGEGGRYAIIRVESAPLGKGMVGVALAIEIPVKLSINGTNHIMTGQITDLEMDEPISTKGPKAILEFNNTGNYHYMAKAEATIKDSSGSILVNASLPLGFSNIIPLSMRSVELTMTPAQELKKGSYTLESTVVRDDGAILDTKKIEFSV